MADKRIHGATKKHVRRQFEQLERPALRPLPKERFAYYEEGQRRVSRDGHIEIQRSFYSVPPEYLGTQVWARWNDQTVRSLNHRSSRWLCIAASSPEDSARWASTWPARRSIASSTEPHIYWEKYGFLAYACGPSAS